MYKVLISTTFLAILMMGCVSNREVVAIYQNYTVCPPNALLDKDSRLLVTQLPAGSQKIVTLTNGLRCVYIVPANLQAQQ